MQTCKQYGRNLVDFHNEKGLFVRVFIHTGPVLLNRAIKRFILATIRYELGQFQLTKGFRTHSGLSNYLQTPEITCEINVWLSCISKIFFPIFFRLWILGKFPTKRFIIGFIFEWKARKKFRTASRTPTQKLHRLKRTRARTIWWKKYFLYFLQITKVSRKQKYFSFIYKNPNLGRLMHLFCALL